LKLTNKARGTSLADYETQEGVSVVIGEWGVCSQERHRREHLTPTYVGGIS